MKYPFVSVIIPAKNEENIIGECFSALLNIEYPKDKYEILLIDNGSSDATITIAEKYNIKYYIREGVSIAALRNYGAKVSRGEILAFVDADVIVSKDWLFHAVSTLNDERIGCTGSSLNVPDDCTWVEKIWNLKTLAKEEIKETGWIASANIIIRKSAFQEIQGFNESLKTCEDVDLCYRLEKRWKIVYDYRIRAVHVGEIKNLFQLFNKESWRGIGNYIGILSHGLVVNEMPSHIVALYYFIFIVLFPLLIIFNKYNYAIYLFFSSLIMPAIKSAAISYRIKTIRHFFSLLIVWFVYGLGRGSSPFRMISLVK